MSIIAWDVLGLTAGFIAFPARGQSQSRRAVIRWPPTDSAHASKTRRTADTAATASGTGSGRAGEPG